MKLTNHGWGLREMIFLSAVIFFFVIIAAVMINNLYSELDLSQGSSGSSSSNGYTYQQIESNLSAAAERYYKTHNDDVSTIVISEDLVELGYLKSSQLQTKDDACEGYAVIADDFRAYITCSNYETVYKHESEVYKEYEELLVKQATSYVEDHSMYPDESLKITDDEMLDDGYLETTYVNGHDCSSYVMVLKSGETYDFEPFIRCGNYKTKGYQ